MIGIFVVVVVVDQDSCCWVVVVDQDFCCCRSVLLLLIRILVVVVVVDQSALLSKVQIDDLERPETAENMSTVNRDTRLDNRILDLRTATKQVKTRASGLQLAPFLHASSYLY